jgi:hypothetical protein
MIEQYPWQSAGSCAAARPASMTSWSRARESSASRASTSPSRWLISPVTWTHGGWPPSRTSRIWRMCCSVSPADWACRMKARRATLYFTSDDSRYAWLDGAHALWEGEFNEVTGHARYTAFLQPTAPAV